MGALIGFLDIIPMKKMKIDKYSIYSAFAFHLVMPTVVLHFSLFTTWVDSVLLYIIMTIPLSILVFKDDKKSPFIMLTTSLAIGIVVGICKSIFN